MPSVVPAHEVRAGRHHGGHGSTVLPSAGERRLGRHAGGGRLHSLLGYLSAEGGISAAIEAGVDKATVYLQSGHGQALPARA
jgi:hypothetical protein